MSEADVWGVVGGAITVGSLLAQTVRTVRTRSADDLSWVFLGLFLAGSILWGTNGVLSGNWPLWLANGLMIALILTTAVVKFLGRHRRPTASRSADEPPR